MQTKDLQLIQRALGHLLRRWPTEMARDALHIVGEELIRRNEEAEHSQKGSDMESKITGQTCGWQVATGGLVDIVVDRSDAQLVGRLQCFIVDLQDRARKAEQERDAAKDLAEQCLREVADLVNLRRMTERQRDETEAARISLLRDHEDTCKELLAACAERDAHKGTIAKYEYDMQSLEADYHVVHNELRDALGTIQGLKAERDASKAPAELEAAAREVVDAFDAWRDAPVGDDEDERIALDSAIDERLRAVLPSVPEQPSLEWTKYTDDDGNAYYESPSPFHYDGDPFHWRLRQCLTDDRIMWYADHDSECGTTRETWSTIEEAQAAIQEAHDRIVREVSAGDAEPEQPEPERVPQRFRWMEDGKWIHGCVVPAADNDGWSVETYTLTARAKPGSIETVVRDATHNQPVEWLDNDYDWSQQ